MRNMLLCGTDGYVNFASPLREVNRHAPLKDKKASDREAPRDLEIIHDQQQEKLTLKIGHLEEGNWAQHMMVLEEVEQYFITCARLDLELQCRLLDENSTLFLMHVLKMAEQYQWLGEKEINVDCYLGLGKSNRYWIKEKLRKCFELDIRFLRFLTMESPGEGDDTASSLSM